MGIFILMVFLWNVYYNRLDASLLLLALLAFNMMSRLILQAPFFSNYFGILPVDLTALCLYSSAALLLAFLTCQHYRPPARRDVCHNSTAGYHCFFQHYI